MEKVDVVRERRWAPRGEVDPASLRVVERETGLPPWVSRILVQRGISNADEARWYLRPDPSFLHPASSLDDLEPLVERLLRARESGEKIMIHGDYDVDGVSATTLLTRVLRLLDFKVLPFVPHRMVDGYGVSSRALRTYREKGVSVVLTCDTGTGAHAEILNARDDLGLDVLVTDHHLAGPDDPPALAHVNPQRPACSYPFKGLAGVGVVYKVLEALVDAVGADREVVLDPYLDLVALGTVCDVVPLVEENRILVSEGLERFADSRVPGIQALLEIVKVSPSEVTAHTLGWLLGPRLNAPGRLEDARISLELLLADDPQEVRALAARVEEINARRIDLTQAVQDRVFRRLEQSSLDESFGIALGPEEGEEELWHLGVLGIVAGRVVERYSRPTFLFGRDPETGLWKGSGRAPSHGHVNLHEILCRTSDLLDRFGGHRLAAGGTLADREDILAAFQEAFDAECQRDTREGDRTPTLAVDAEVRLEDLSADDLQMMARFAPFGHMNEPIHLAIRDVGILWARSAGRENAHLKLGVESGGRTFEVLGRQMTSMFPELVRGGHRWRGDLLLRLEEEVAIGGRRVPFVLVDIQNLKKQEAASDDGIDLLDRIRPRPQGAMSPEESRRSPRNLFSS